MQTTGLINDISRDWESGKFKISLLIDNTTGPELSALRSADKLTISITKYRKRRSLDANAMLWACIGEMAAELRADKWEIYLKMLRRYGKYTYICVKPSAVEAVKASWRECEEIGSININGTDAVQLLCYFGSSTYDSKEFSVLLDGVVSEMKELGLTPPPPKHIEEAIAKWKSHSTAPA